MTTKEILNMIHAKMIDYMKSAHAMKHCEKSHLKLLAKAEAMDYLHKELTKKHNPK